MARIVLIRPGSTDYDEQGRIQGTLDVPLNHGGGDEVARTINELRAVRFDAVFYSNCQAARQTAEAIAKAAGVKPKKLDGMRNLCHGLWQGMRVDEVRRTQPKVYRQWQEVPHTVCPPEGEMLDAADIRIEACMTKLLRRRKESTIALIVPEPLASLVRRFLDHGALGDLWKATLDQHAHWEILDVHPHGAQSFNAQPKAPATNRPYSPHGAQSFNAQPKAPATNRPYSPHKDPTR